jgi:hypothetical protein
MSDVRKLIQFLRSKGISGDDIAEAVMLATGGVDPDDPAMDEPAPFPGQPLTGGKMVPLNENGGKALDAKHRKIVNDEMVRIRLRDRKAYDEHREGLGLRRIRNLG